MRSKAKLWVFLRRFCFYVSWLVIPLCVFILWNSQMVRPLISWMVSAILFFSFMWLVTVMGSLDIFPYEYSLLGVSKRSRHIPDEPPLMSLTSGFSTGTLFGGLSQPSSMFRFRLFREGLEIRIFPFGKVFISIASFQRVEKGILPFHYALFHKHNEVRSPINFTSKRLFEALNQLMQAAR